LLHTGGSSRRTRSSMCSCQRWLSLSALPFSFFWHAALA
jgi:hypothetical protein